MFFDWEFVLVGKEDAGGLRDLGADQRERYDPKVTQTL